MEGHLTYKIGDKDVQMFFGNYAVEETLAHFNASVSDISELLNTKLLPFMRVFIYHSAAYPVLEAKEIPEFTPFDVHKWIDETGGTSGDFMKTASRMVYKALGLKVDEEQPEGKKKVQLKSA